MIDKEQLKSMVYYMHGRERARVNKEAGVYPHSSDRYLAAARATNILRIYDRTTKHFKAIYDANGDAKRSLILFHCGVYRYFGTTEFADAYGWREDWNPEVVAQLAKERQARGERVWTTAYTISPQKSTAPKADTVVAILSRLWERRIDIANIAHRTKSWEKTANALLAIDGFGDFMAKETLLDAMMTKALPDATDAFDWTLTGPGGRRGLNRIHNRPIAFKPKHEQCLREILALRERLQPLLKPHMPILSAADVQWNLCEWDKYRRVKFDGAPIRRRYEPPTLKLRRLFPPKPKPVDKPRPDLNID